MSDYWPLLVAEPLDGERLVNSQLRPRLGAVAVDQSDYAAAQDAVIELCGTWGGAGAPVIPVTPGTEVDERWSRILNESNIDGIERTDLLTVDETRKYTDLFGPAPAQLIRVLVDLERKPVVQTVRGMSASDPWHLAYLAVLGDLSPHPHPQNTWNDLRPDLAFQDVLSIRGVDGEGSVAGLLGLLRDFTAVSAVELSRSKLSGGLQAGYNKGLAESSRFQWSDDQKAHQYGPNIVVLYEPGSVDDLALIWNLRARFVHPPRFPLAVPMSPSVESDLRSLLEQGAEHHFGFGRNLAITSFSIAETDLRALGDPLQFDVVNPWDLLRPIGGYCVTSTEVLQFAAGKATIPSFSPTDMQAIGGSYLGSHQGTWMKRKTVVVDDPIPSCRTMRRGVFHGDAHYLDGPISTGGEPGAYTTVRLPSGLEVLRALGIDRGLNLTESAPGKAGEQLIRAAGTRLSMFAAPGAVAALSELTRGRNVSIVRKRLNQFLADPELDETSDRYQLLFDRLDQALGVPEVEELGYMRFDRLRTLLRMSAPAAQQWLKWAMSGGLVLRGVDAHCVQCGQKQWRPLSETVPALVCYGCGRTIENPHGYNHIEYRYRASEILLRAMSHDILPCVLSMRYLSSVLGGKESVFGSYPGVEFRQPDSTKVDAEADVLVVLRNGALILGECKSNARGLKPEELEKLWASADRLGARATFAATLDRASNCGPEWRTVEAPSGRPHFALTAEHLFDLDCMGPVHGEDLFEWKDDYYSHLDGGGDGEGAIADQEKLIDKEFNDYAERTGKDYQQHFRAPWTRSPDD